MDDFYIYLPSNSSGNYYQNTLSHFKTKLARRIELGEHWLCGLSEIIYNGSHTNFDNYDEDEGINTIILQADAEKEIIKFPRSDFVSLEHLFTFLISLVKSHHLGQLMVDECVGVIQKKMHTAETMPFEPPYNKDAHTNTLKYNNHIIKFGVGNYQTISDFFDEIEKFAISKQVRVELLARSLALLMNNLNYFYKLSVQRKDYVLAHVYVDIIESVLSGDVSARTIRIVELDRRGGHLLFNPVYYHQLSQFNFDNVLVEILDDDGEYINFRPSEKPTLIVLHFKRIV